MLRYWVGCLIYLLLAGVSQVQEDAVLKGWVTDESKEPLIGANVVLLNKDSIQITGTITDIAGRFRLPAREDAVLLKISYLGYEPYLGRIISGDTIVLSESIRSVGEVVIKGEKPVVKVNGDTLEYDAASYQVHQNAVAEDVLAKIPGISISGGKITAHGEEVTAVYVDGKPFFGEDPNMAIKNLPADMIDKVQVYDKQSDQAAFTGFRDGNTEKAINIRTKSSKSAGIFGKLYAGAGLDKRYLGGGDIHIFKGQRRISFIGLSNNINQQNFSAADLVGMTSSGSSQGQGSSQNRGGMSGPPPGMGNTGNGLVTEQNGINRSHAAGVNYSDVWGKAKRAEVTGSYFYNNTRNTTDNQTGKLYWLSDTVSQTSDQQNTSEGVNQNHRGNLKMDIKIDSQRSVLITPAVILQDYQQEAVSTAVVKDVSGNIISSQANTSTAQQSGYQLTLPVLYRHQLAKKGRTFSAEAKAELSGKEGAKTIETDLSGTGTGEQRIGTGNDQLQLSASLNYTEPAGKNGMLQFSYQPAHTTSKVSRQVEGVDNEELLSNTLEYSLWTHKAGTFYRWSRSGWNLTSGVQVQHIRQGQTQRADPENKDYFDVLPQLDIFYTKSKRQFIHFRYDTRTSLPGASQLLEVLNTEQPLSVSTGNAALERQYSHNIMAGFRNTNAAYTHIFFWGLMAGMTDNYIGNSTFTAEEDTWIDGVYLLTQGSSLTRPVNLGRQYSVRSFMNYSMPFYAIKSNLSWTLSYQFAKTPSLVNEVLNRTTSHQWSLDFAVNSNISKNIDFRMGYNAGYTIAAYEIQSEQQTYYTGKALAQVKAVPFRRLNLYTDLNLTHYMGWGESISPVILWNAGLSYLLLSKEQLEIGLSVNDILSSNNSISRTVTDAYVEDSRTKVLQRYFLLKMTYYLRN